jgi:hypothetical protein
MSATVFSANANVSRHARRAPLTGTVQREVSDRQRGFLKVLTRVPEAIDPNLPVPSAGERLLLTAAAGFAWDSGNEIYTALAAARRKERERLELPKLTKGRNYGQTTNRTIP